MVRAKIVESCTKNTWADCNDLLAGSRVEASRRPAPNLRTQSTPSVCVRPALLQYRARTGRNYGTTALVHAVERAAQEVARLAPSGARLLVGDLSAEFGGRVSGHASHRTGRDVDLLLYATTLDGISVATPGFVHFGADGLACTASGEYVQLDVRREWILIRSLLTDPEAEVLWIFASREIEAHVTAYALSIGEPPQFVARAISVLHQPRDSASHDDHLHVRVACTAHEHSTGCESGGPAWPWLHTAPTQDDALAYEDLSDEDPLGSI